MPPSLRTSKNVLSLCFGAAAAARQVARRSCLFGRSGRFLCLRVENERNESEQDGKSHDANNAGGGSRVDY